MERNGAMRAATYQDLNGLVQGSVRQRRRPS